MAESESGTEPDWDIPLQITVTPGQVIHALFATAESVHTGWQSCVDNKLVIADLSSMDEGTGNYCRLVEQEFVEEAGSEEVWRDWVVELRLGEVLIAGHWYAQLAGSPMELDWCGREAESAFDKACVLLGRKVRRGITVEEPVPQAPPPKRRHH